MKYHKNYYHKVINVRYSALNEPQVCADQKNKTPQRMALILACVGILLLLSACDNGRAMQSCQEVHSYDTCFYALNR